MLMISLLEPYRKHLPPGSQLVVALWSDHIEAGLWNGYELTRLMAGEQSSWTNATILRPSFLMILLLRDYPGALDGLHYLDPHLTKGSQTSDQSITMGKRHEQCTTTSWWPFSTTSCDPRHGILEHVLLSDLNPMTGSEGSDSGG
jgi:hypothetical protein